jgi:serine/threonine-protein phosphatase 6 catalytic subunit
MHFALPVLAPADCRPTCLAVPQEGLKYMFPDRSLVTVWSAPNYCYRCGNVASILCFDSALEREVKYFTETDENSNMMAPRAAVPYFL